MHDETLKLINRGHDLANFEKAIKSLKKRNTVLKCMLECNFIDENTYQNSIKMPLDAVQNSVKGKNYDYLHAVFDELEELGLNAYDLTDGCIIKTYLIAELQSFIENHSYDCDN